MEHGITIRENSTGKLVKFIKCNLGREALTILSGARRNLGIDYSAEEDFVEESEIAGLKE